MDTESNDILNSYFTGVVNNILSKIGLEEIQPTELKNICLTSTYQSTQKPETVLFINCTNRVLSLTFKNGKLITSKWLHLKG